MMRLFTCCALALSVGLPVLAQPEPADTGAKSIEERREEARIDRLWTTTWRDIATRYIQHEEQYIYVDGYSPGYPSSVGKTISQYQQESAWQQKYTDEIGRDKTRKLTRPTADAFVAVASLPEVKTGNYGYIHSGHIEAVIDRRTVQLEEIWLVDEYQVRDERDALMDKAMEQASEDIAAVINDKRDRKRYRDDAMKYRDAERKAVNWMFGQRAEAVTRQRSRTLSSYQWNIIGYRTDRLTEDARWPSGKAAEQGLQVIIVQVKDRTVTAVPAASIGKGLNETQFLAMLESRGLDKQGFVEMVTDVRRGETNRDKANDQIFARLEGAEEKPTEEEAQPKPLNDTIELAE